MTDVTKRLKIQVKTKTQRAQDLERRILTNHACATGAQYQQYQAIAADGSVATWPRFNGW